MTIETVLTPKEILELFKYSKQHTGKNIVLKIIPTSIADVHKITTQGSSMEELLGLRHPAFWGEWKNITDWEGV